MISQRNKVCLAWDIFYVTGTADFILVVTARDNEAYDAFMSRRIADDPNVRRFTTDVALGAGKRSLGDPDRPGRLNGAAFPVPGRITATEQGRDFFFAVIGTFKGEIV